MAGPTQRTGAGTVAAPAKESQRSSLSSPGDQCFVKRHSHRSIGPCLVDSGRDRLWRIRGRSFIERNRV